MLRVLLFIIGITVTFILGYLTGRRITKKYTVPILKHELGLFYDSIIDEITGAKERRAITKLYNETVPKLDRYKREDYL